MTVAAAFDPKKVDAYATHLAKVNTVKDVIATEDICNQQGAILIPKGATISTQATEKIIRFKLIRPLHDTVAIDGEIGEHALYEAMIAILQRNTDLHNLHEQHDLDLIIKQRCQFYQRFSVLKQKLTVLSVQMTKTYDNALLSAWLCTLIGVRMQLSEEDLNALFLAALTHDFGMLHIDPDILNKKGELTPEEWRQIHAHVVIGKTILEEIPGLPKATSTAVLEHHERCDGTGYPTQKDGTTLGLLGQIIAMSDSMIAIYSTRFVKEQRSLREIIPILQVNNEAHFYRTYDTIVTVLRNSNLPKAKGLSAEDIPPLIQKFANDGQVMNAQLDLVSDVITTLEHDTKNRKLTALHNVFELINKVVNGSGILGDSYHRWIDQVREEKLEFAYREIEDSALMLKELQFHLKRLTRMLHLYAKHKNTDNSTQLTIMESLKKLSQLAQARRAQQDAHSEAYAL